MVLYWLNPSGRRYTLLRGSVDNSDFVEYFMRYWESPRDEKILWINSSMEKELEEWGFWVMVNYPMRSTIVFDKLNPFVVIGDVGEVHWSNSFIPGKDKKPTSAQSILSLNRWCELVSPLLPAYKEQLAKDEASALSVKATISRKNIDDADDPKKYSVRQRHTVADVERREATRSLLQYMHDGKPLASKIK